MKKHWAAFFYSSQQWQHTRDYVFKRDKGLCQDCLKKNKVTPAEEVHHIKPITPDNIMDPSITLNENNLISLCKECHKARHGARDYRYTVDEFGRVTIK
jgi:5-methylcytosine-specific restriction endonuclease McrA